MTNRLVAEYGAAASVDYKRGDAEQVREISRITGGNLEMVLHAVEGQGIRVGIAALEESSASVKRLASVQSDMYAYPPVQKHCTFNEID